MEDFKKYLCDADLWDIRPREGWFTWSRGTKAQSIIKERIDRFVASNDWRLMFRNCSVLTVPTTSSDHYTLFLNLKGSTSARPPHQVCDQLYQAKVKLNEIIDKDEAYWIQRSRVAWLREGDWNTTFFHTPTNGRKKKN
ncbi:uncharacterized protein LOC120209875 [Hibiscus syriacus]|uniref:uncharacterized protein LOC120209875 n=1 Tax=Hibiscus syriacus TaxID=106335 RepID=UPI00192130BB|nr:uncharacterized protein LOC120209875 [Hibiscus syriacus]